MTIRTVRQLRRLSQILFFGVFFWLILKTTFETSWSPANQGAIELPYPVSIGLEFDPLTALMTLLSSGTLHQGLLWSVIILIPTIFLGRFFCGWICPLGSLNHWISEIRSERSSRKGARKLSTNRYHWYQRIKYYLLLILLGGAMTGVLQMGLLDPLALLARSLGTVVLPMTHTAALAVVEWAHDTGIGPVETVANGVYGIVEWTLLPFRQAHFHAVLSIGLFFLLILVLNRWLTRFWCRGICPLGALLGLCSRWAVFGLQKDQSTCDHCNLCLVHCQGADNPDVGEKWRQAECHLCLNCQAVCPQNSLSFKFFPNQQDTRENPAGTSSVDITRRKAVASVAAGVALYPLFRSGDAFAVNSNPKLIRPPFALREKDFLATCIRCGQCMRVCPNNALHPALLEGGFEAVWSPRLIPRIGYCEPTCTLCGQVCPTGSIAEFTAETKIGTDSIPPNRIGTAFIDRGRCLPWAMATPCIVCEEWCPTTPKAVYLEEVSVSDRDGNAVTVKQPHVDPNHCTGCGACEFACPVAGEAAVYVNAVGESRSKSNQILLERGKQSNGSASS